MAKKNEACPCGRGKGLAECCGRYLAGAAAPDAESLMRSRYTAYTLGDEAYLLATWHSTTRPESLGLTSDTPTKWLGLEIKRCAFQDANHATVSFVARYKIHGRAQRMSETSRFLRQDGRWVYLDGEVEN